MAKFEKPFRVGDVVRFARHEVVGVGSEGDLYDDWKIGQKHIIREYNIDLHEYATNRGAWIGHACFELVRECDAKSMKQLKKDLLEESESYYE